MSDAPTRLPEVGSADRAAPEMTRTVRSKAWIAVGAGLLLLGVLVFGRTPPSETPRRGASDVATLRNPPPKLGPIPEAEDERSEVAEDIEDPCFDPADGESAGPDARVETASAAEPSPNPFELEWQAELQRRALEASEERLRRAELRRRSSIVVFDESMGPREAAESPSAPPSSQLVSSGGFAAPGLARRTVFSGEGPEPTVERAFAPTPRSREEEFTRGALEPVETIRAQRIEHPETVVPQGTMIRGVLETAIQSDLPGMVRAQVTEPVYSFSGALVVPRGATLIGKYQSGLVRGQTRVFVIWTRLLRPDGVSVQLASPGTDLLGRTGVGGEIDTHFFERFSSSIVLSLIDGGLAIAAARAQESDNSTIVQGGGQNLKNAAELALQNSVNIPPTVQVARGTPIQVFVAQDLDFVETIRRDPIQGGR